MIGDLFLALALGQAPAPLPPGTVASKPVSAVPGPVGGNLTGANGETYVPNGDGTYRVGPASTAGPAASGSADQRPTKEAEKEAEDSEAAQKKYFLEKLLEGSVAGQLLSDNGIKVYGWIGMNYSGSSARRSNLPVTFNDRANYYQLNQNYLIFEKAIDTTKKEVQFGFQTDYILPGTDSRFTIARGLLDQQLRSGPNGTATGYPIDLFQAFGTVFLPNVGAGGTTVKLGKFASIIGYDVVQAAQAFSVSKSYLFQYNPFTHTGFLATTQLSDDWSVSNGGVVGNDNFFDSSDRATYLGQIRWAPPKGDTTAQLSVSATNPKYDTAEAYPHFNAYNFILTHQFNEKFQYVFDGTFSHQDNFPGVGSANWFRRRQLPALQSQRQAVVQLAGRVVQRLEGRPHRDRGAVHRVDVCAELPAGGLLVRQAVRALRPQQKWRVRGEGQLVHRRHRDDFAVLIAA